MQNQLKKIIILTLLSSMMVLSASYLAPLQNWLIFNASLNKGDAPLASHGYLQMSGIRHMVTFQSPKSASFSENKAIMTANVPQSSFNHETGFDYAENYEQTPKVGLPTESDVFNSSSESSGRLPITIKKLPLIIEFDNELMVKFTSNYSDPEIHRAISRLLVMPDQINAQSLLSKQTIDTKKQPYLYHRVLNQYKEPMRYPAQAYRYAEYLISHSLHRVTDEKGSFTVLSIPLIKNVLPPKVKSYQAWVERFSGQSQVSPELVYAIMEVESAFNPKAVSTSNALGLMQIKAGSAGRDVYQYIDGKMGQPSKKTLFDPQENIRIGVAYLGLLKNMYFEEINNEHKKDLLAIASYNGGLTTVLKLFGKTPPLAINQLNRMSIDRIYHMLLNRHESAETRHYVKKVMNKRKKYQKILELAA